MQKERSIQNFFNTRQHTFEHTFDDVPTGYDITTDDGMLRGAYTARKGAGKAGWKKLCGCSVAGSTLLIEVGRISGLPSPPFGDGTSGALFLPTSFPGLDKPRVSLRPC